MFSSLNGPKTILVRLNGVKNPAETQVPVCVDETIESFHELIERVSEQMGTLKTKKAKLYNQNGIQLFGDDVLYLKNDQIVYFSPQGEEFDFNMVLEQYEILKKLGEGGFGKVMLARHKESGKLAAIKFMNVSEYLHQANQINEIYREADALKKLEHKNIVALYNAFVQDKQVILVMEYASGGELLSYVKEKGTLHETEARSIIVQTLQAMSFCHNRGIIHRDLKMENILFADESRAIIKVVDFGIAGAYTKKFVEKTDAGSLKYMPPELVSSENVNASPLIDIWAIGVMLYAMLFGCLPFNGDSTKEIVDNIISKRIDIPKDKYITAECIDLLKKMLEKQTSKRIQMVDILNHKWFELNDADIEDKEKKMREAEIQKQRDEEEKKEKRPFLSDLLMNQAQSSGQQKPESVFASRKSSTKGASISLKKNTSQNDTYAQARKSATGKSASFKLGVPGKTPLTSGGSKSPLGKTLPKSPSDHRS